jgi:hypothetical protein
LLTRAPFDANIPLSNGTVIMPEKDAPDQNVTLVPVSKGITG